MEKYLVSLDDEERAALLDVTRKGKAAARRIIHARILLLAVAAARQKLRKVYPAIKA